ncbi:general substrate transporter [Gongronella butleri]|nr:general substrate transporter [Gongronella butleri]
MDVVHSGATAPQLEGITSLCALGGSLLAGAFADRIGRKTVLAISAILFIITSPLQIAAENTQMFQAGRAISGLATGAFTVIIPLFIAEIAPKDLRGRLIAIEQFALTLGIASADWITYAANELPSSSSWRLPNALVLIPCTVFVLSLFVIPESPRYLVSKREDVNALEVLATIRGDGTINHPHVIMEYHAMRQAIRYENSFPNHNSYARLFSGPPENNFRRLMLGVTTQSAFQWTGANVIITFAAQIFPNLDLNVDNRPIFYGAISSTAYCLSSFLALIFIDKFGRRPTMFTGALLGFSCLLIMGVISLISNWMYAQKPLDLGSNSYSDYESIVTRNTPQEYRNAIAFLVVGYLFIAIMGYSWGVLTWVYPTELYSQSMRAMALSISTGLGWMFIFVLVKITPIMLMNIRGGTYLVFAMSSLITAIIVYRFFPETKGKSLEEVDLIFQCNINYFDVNTRHPQSAADALAEMEKLRGNETILHPFRDMAASGGDGANFDYPVVEDLYTYHRRQTLPAL